MINQGEILTTSQKLIRAFLNFRRLGIDKGKTFQGTEGNLSKNLKHSEIILLFSIKEMEKEHPDGVSVSDLSAYLGIKSPSITPSLSSLEEKQMLERSMDSFDRRIVRINLKERGNQFINECSQGFVNHLQGLVDYLGDEKSNQLAELLNEVFEYASQNPPHKPHK